MRGVIGKAFLGLVRSAARTRFGAQNKAPRLRNDRDFAEVLLRFAKAGY